MDKRERRACCCLPVRIGVALTSIGGLVLGVGFTVVGILAANKLDSQLAFDARLSIQLHVFVYLLLGIFSILGLICALNRSRKLAVFSFSAYAAHLPVTIGSGAFFIYILFSSKNDQIFSICMEAAGGSKAKEIFLTKDICNQNVSVLRGASVAILVIVWLWEFYSCIILNSYVKELAPSIYKPDYVISP